MNDWTGFAQGIMLGALAAVAAYYFLTYDKPAKAKSTTPPPSEGGKKPEDPMFVGDRVDVILW